MAQTALIWKLYAESKAAGQREQLIERYAPLAKYVVDRLHVALPPSLGYEDLIGQAVIGLIEAVDSFDPSRGVKFETYACHRIRGAVMDMLREMDLMPRSLRKKERELKSADGELRGRLGREPTGEELAAELGISPGELARLHSSLRLQEMQSLNEVVANSQGELVEAMELVADGSAASPEAETEQEAEREILVGAIEELPEKERRVIGLYYQEGLTMKEIARVLGVSESRVCQLHGRALSKLRARLTSEEGGDEHPHG
jgi:RNA polymerase sigma factor for flagellar operon FliA